MKKNSIFTDKSIVLWVLGIICIILIAGTVFTAFLASKRAKEADGEPKDTQDRYISYNGNKYEKDPDIRLILFLGIDKEATADLNGNPGENGQSDSINLLILNTREKTGQFLQISRDTIVPIDVYDIQGEQILTEEGQLALQYAYGDGKKKSCRMTKEKVEELMYGISIPDYFALTIDGISTAADALGGIPITVPEDYTDIDPAFQKGADLVLKGEMAEKYVRGRNTEELDSNVSRMARQTQVIQALLKKFQEENMEEKFPGIYQKISPYLITNMSTERIQQLTDYQISEEVLSVPGEIRTDAEGKAAFYPVESEVKELVIKLIYKKIDS